MLKHTKAPSIDRSTPKDVLIDNDFEQEHRRSNRSVDALLRLCLYQKRP